MRPADALEFESAGFNVLMVSLIVAAGLFVILVGAFYIHPDNWDPFASRCSPLRARL